IYDALLNDSDYGPISEKARPMIEKGYTEVTEGVNFVQDFLVASNIEKGTFAYDIQPLDFKKIVIEVGEKQKEIVKEKGLSLDLTVADGDYNIKGDAGQLSQAVKNLIDNSIRYTPTGGLKVTLERKDDKVLLTIQDTGVGISDELKPRLFTKGGRDSNSIKININSTGYGLSFVKGVVEAHHGRVWADSVGPNQGSTFYVELPVS
ncbi:MAG: Histidine kinase-, DNA gyrase B-, and, partial [Microgenomates group bacterium GW2011_GWC1_39_7]